MQQTNACRRILCAVAEAVGTGSEFRQSRKGERLTTTTKIVVASLNPVKIEATRTAFATLLTGVDLSIVGVSTDSGVSDQPVSDTETLHGARNRRGNARQTHADADYWVGIEGGIEVFDDQLLAFAWMSIESKDKRRGEARSPTLTLPAAVKRLIDQGKELGDANDEVFATINSKQGGGAYGLLSDGLYTRESIYTQTLILALLPLVKKVYQ